ncbi:helix-turn-helix domain-containing protein [Xanthobacter sp. VTT E-85241]|uniref:helix-turn-helix domain-containing protein n=1 Tax=Roseixanthobacter finlandensis TaxID=3119922 RepID=UPI0037286CD1
MKSDGFASRLESAIQPLSVNAFALKCGVLESSIRSYLRGTSVPGLDKAAAMAEAAGVTLDWLWSGKGPMRHIAGQSQIIPADPALMGRVVAAIAEAHREAGIALPEAQLGRVAYEVLSEIAAASEGPDEYPDQMQVMLKRLKRRLQQAVLEPGTGKRSA